MLEWTQHEGSVVCLLYALHNIEVIFIIKPLAAGEISFDHLLINCQKKLKINDILDKIYIGDCY